MLELIADFIKWSRNNIENFVKRSIKNSRISLNNRKLKWQISAIDRRIKSNFVNRLRKLSQIPPITQKKDKFHQSFVTKNHELPQTISEYDLEFCCKYCEFRQLKHCVKNSNFRLRRTENNSLFLWNDHGIKWGISSNNHGIKQQICRTIA